MVERAGEGPLLLERPRHMRHSAKTFLKDEMLIELEAAT